MATHKIAQLGIGYCPEERGIFSSLSCEENLMLPPTLAEGGGVGFSSARQAGEDATLFGAVADAELRRLGGHRRRFRRRAP